MNKGSVSITTLTSTPDCSRLLLEGQLVIRNASSIKRELMLALNSSQNLELIFKNIIKIDITVLQLLIALQKSALVLQKKLSFDMELNDHIRSVLQNSGLQKILMTNLKAT